MNRRTFLHTSTAAGLALSATSLKNYGAELTGGKTLKVGLIGSGWYGKCDLLRLIQVAPVEVVGLCDVDTKMLDEAAKLVATRQKSGKEPRQYTDYKKMIAEEEMDVVEVATPDHWHALPLIDAVKAGLDVYVQKPTGVDVVESQAMLAAARKYGRTVQVGTQRRSTPHLIEARDRVIREGLLGKIAHADLCCYYHMRARQNPPISEPPAHFDYDAWTGPAPLLPYTSLGHPRSWRAYMEYSNGIMGDMCVHMLDMVRWILDLGWPTRIASQGGILVDKASRATTYDTQTATFDFDDFTATWQHRSWGHAPDPEYPWAAFIYGDKGTLKLSVHKYEFIPRGNGKPMKREVKDDLEAMYEQYPEDRNEKDLERHVASAIRGHMIDFLEARAKQTLPVADIEQGHISSASCILANIAAELGETLVWDAQKGRVTNSKAANERLARSYRAPYVHPTPENV